MKQIKYPSDSFKAKMDYKSWKAQDLGGRGDRDGHDQTAFEPRETHLRRTLTRQSMDRHKNKGKQRQQGQDINQVNNNYHDNKETEFIDIERAPEGNMNRYYEQPGNTTGEMQMGQLIMSGAVRRSTRRKVRKIDR